MMQIRVFDLYGIGEGNLEQAASLLTQAIDLPFQGRSSGFWGDHFSARSSDRQEVFDLKENANSIEGDLNWPEYAEHPLLLEVVVESSERAHEIKSRVLSALEGKAVLLERNEYRVSEQQR